MCLSLGLICIKMLLTLQRFGDAIFNPSVYAARDFAVLVLIALYLYCAYSLELC